MPNKTVKHKVLDTPNTTNKSTEWIQLAEDAERDAAKARERSKQLTEAARIFRRNEHHSRNLIATIHSSNTVFKTLPGGR
jgi:hypothetical protein